MVPAADVWVDVKTPGDGRTYQVGTTNVTDTRLLSNPTFSDVAITSTPGVPAVAGATPRQVVVVRCLNAAGGVIWQRYYHGFTNGQQGNGLSANARAVSVFPVVNPLTGLPDEEESRVAICGETFDEALPLGQATNPYYSNTKSSGFIAVYTGDGQLLWSHLFFGGNSDGNCAITDVSMRVEGQAPNQTDVVTYCGASSFGNVVTPPQTSTLATPRAFTAPTPLAPCADNPAGGSGINDAGQWDGLVGRLTRAHAGTVPTEQVFGSLVGGRQQDGLFGLAEIDENRFVVVGSTRQATGTILSQYTFPVTGGDCITTSVDPAMGTILLFDATLTRQPVGDLQLVASRLIGPNRSNPTNELVGETCARDVIVHGGRILVVGSTDDAGLPTAFAFDTALDGPTDGFIAGTSAFLINLLPDAFLQLTYFGIAEASDEGHDGLTGIAAWNEYADHFAVTGFRDTVATSDIVTASIWVTTDSLYPLPVNTLQLIRDHVVVGPGAETPCGIGITHAMGSFTNGSLRNPGGGGISVDESFRATIVGSTDAGIAPVGVGRLYSLASDGVHIVLDFLPPGVCRTDGTGQCPGAPAPMGAGTTTPTCALSPLGRRIEVPQQPPAQLDRILIDFQGHNLSLQDVALIMDRPPPNYQIQGTYLQFGFISNPPLVVSGVEIWMLNNPVLTTHWPQQGASASIWFSLDTLPPGPAQVTAQFVCVVTTPLNCTGATLVASPALTFTW